MKKLLFFLIIMLSFSIIVSAEQQTLGTFKLNSCVRVVQTCGNCTSISIPSIIYPNGETAQTSITMSTGDNIEWYYNFCKANITGQYIVNTLGDVDGVNTVVAYNFFVTESGNESSFDPTILLLFGILLSYFLIFYSFNQGSWAMNFLGSTLLIGISLYIIFSGLGALSFNDTLWVKSLVIINLGISFISLLISSWEVLQLNN